MQACLNWFYQTSELSTRTERGARKLVSCVVTWPASLLPWGIDIKHAADKRWRNPRHFLALDLVYIVWSSITFQNGSMIFLSTILSHSRGKPAVRADVSYRNLHTLHVAPSAKWMSSRGARPTICKVANASFCFSRPEEPCDDNSKLECRRNPQGASTTNRTVS